jgi:hypothetical protein
MARKISTVENTDSPSLGYPNGRVRNDDLGNGIYGTPLKEELLGDVLQFTDKIMREGVLLGSDDFNNLPESEVNDHQIFNALLKILDNRYSGELDSYTIVDFYGTLPTIAKGMFYYKSGAGGYGFSRIENLSANVVVYDTQNDNIPLYTLDKTNAQKLRFTKNSNRAFIQGWFKIQGDNEESIICRIPDGYEPIGISNSGNDIGICYINDSENAVTNRTIQANIYIKYISGSSDVENGYYLMLAYPQGYGIINQGNSILINSFNYRIS